MCVCVCACVRACVRVCVDHLLFNIPSILYIDPPFNYSLSVLFMTHLLVNTISVIHILYQLIYIIFVLYIDHIYIIISSVLQIFYSLLKASAQVDIVVPAVLSYRQRSPHNYFVSMTSS